MAKVLPKIAGSVVRVAKRKAVPRVSAKRRVAAKGYRTVISLVTGLPVTVPPASVPKVTTAQVRALLADFP